MFFLKTQAIICENRIIFKKFVRSDRDEKFYHKKHYKSIIFRKFYIFQKIVFKNFKNDIILKNFSKISLANELFLSF